MVKPNKLFINIIFCQKLRMMVTLLDSFFIYLFIFPNSLKYKENRYFYHYIKIGRGRIMVEWLHSQVANSFIFLDKWYFIIFFLFIRVKFLLKPWENYRLLHRLKVCTKLGKKKKKNQNTEATKFGCLITEDKHNSVPNYNEECCWYEIQDKDHCPQSLLSLLVW